MGYNHVVQRYSRSAPAFANQAMGINCINAIPSRNPPIRAATPARVGKKSAANTKPSTIRSEPVTNNVVRPAPIPASAQPNNGLFLRSKAGSEMAQAANVSGRETNPSGWVKCQGVAATKNAPTVTSGPR